MKPLLHGFAAGSIGIAVLRNLFIFWPQYFYNPPEGKGTVYLSATLFGIGMLVGKLVDIVTDLLVGYQSDRTAGRFGRRLPYLLAGSPLWLLACYLLFRPPVAGPSPANFVFFTVMTSLFFLGSTLVGVPYLAVVPEVSAGERERVGLSVNMGRYGILGAVAAMAVSPLLVGSLGFHAMVSTMLLVAAVPLALATLSVRSTPLLNREPGGGAPLLASILSLVRQKSCWTYLLGHLFFCFGYYMILVAVPFLVTEVICLDIRFMGLFIVLTLVLGGLASPWIHGLALRLGKVGVIRVAVLFFAVIFSLWFFVGRVDWPGSGLSLPWGQGDAGGRPDPVPLSRFLEALLLFGLFGFPVGTLLFIPTAVGAELTEVDARQTGVRREAFVFGTLAGFEKVAIMLASLVAPLMLALGNSSANPLGIRLIGPVAAVCAVCGWLALRFCPLK